MPQLPTIHRYEGGPAMTNAYLLVHSDGNSLLIDAPEGVNQWLDTLEHSPSAVLLTHQHYDHVLGAAELEKRDIPLYAWEEYSPELTLEKLVGNFGLPLSLVSYSTRTLKSRDQFSIGGFDFQLLFVPGHSPDSIVLYLPEYELAFAGDTLFSGSIGRTDLPHGNHEQLLSGIREKLYSLPSDTKILPGHGPETSIAIEKSTNPFVRA